MGWFDDRSTDFDWNTMPSMKVKLVAFSEASRGDLADPMLITVGPYSLQYNFASEFNVGTEALQNLVTIGHNEPGKSIVQSNGLEPNGNVFVVDDFEGTGKLLAIEACEKINGDATTPNAMVVGISLGLAGSPCTITEQPTSAPTTLAPTLSPTTQAPTDAPTTLEPTVSPTTFSPTSAPSPKLDEAENDIPPSPIMIQPLVAQKFSASIDEVIRLKMDIPDTTTSAYCAIGGGTGDADLTARWNYPVNFDNLYANDCVPFKHGNSEQCTGADLGPPGRELHLGLYAYRGFTDVIVICMLS